MDDDTTYVIKRFYRDDSDLNGEIIETGLTLEEARAHCKDPETSSGTCSTQEGLKRLREHGPWYDGYDEE
jgi:hypothetical protein